MWKPSSCPIPWPSPLCADTLEWCGNFSPEAGGISVSRVRCSAHAACCHCYSFDLFVFHLFTDSTDTKLIQIRLPEFIYCALLNFPFLISLNKAPLYSEPQLVLQSGALTLLSSAVAEEPFLILKSSCRNPSTGPQEQPCSCWNATSPCFFAFCTLDHFWRGSVALLCSSEHRFFLQSHPDQLWACSHPTTWHCSLLGKHSESAEKRSETLWDERSRGHSEDGEPCATLTRTTGLGDGGSSPFT